MNTKSKSTLVLVGVLLLGVVIGVLAHRPLFKMHKKRGMPFSHPESIQRMVEHKLQPTAEQRKQIRPIIAKHGKSFRTMHKKHQKEISELMDSFKADLEPLLTPEQIDKLDKKRFSRPGMPGRRNKMDHGRHHPGKSGRPGKDGWHKQQSGNRRMMSGDRMSERLTDLIKPDDTQKDTVTAIIQKHMDTMPQRQEEPPFGMKSILKNIRTDLEPLLTPEQLERLDQRIEMMQSRRGAGEDRPGE